MKAEQNVVAEGSLILLGGAVGSLADEKVGNWNSAECNKEGEECPVRDCQWHPRCRCQCRWWQ